MPNTYMPFCAWASSNLSRFGVLGPANEGGVPGVFIKLGFVQLIRDELLYVGMRLLICQWRLHVHERKAGTLQLTDDGGDPHHSLLDHLRWRIGRLHADAASGVGRTDRGRQAARPDLQGFSPSAILSKPPTKVNWASLSRW